jgi:hypothetical protein
MVGAVLCVVAAALTLFTSAGASAALPVQPQTQPHTPDVRACVTKGGSEWAGCLSMTARLSNPPAVGAQANLEVEVTAQVDLDRVQVLLDLPDLLRWHQVPDGFHTERHASAVPSDGGAATSAVTGVDLKAGKPLVLRAAVTAVRAGSTVLRVRATSAAGLAGSDAVDVALTIGPDSASSRLGMPAGDDAAEPTPAGTKITPANPHLPYVPASTTGLPEPRRTRSGDGPSAQALSCVTGGFDYQDNNGAFHAAKNIQYQVLDDDIGGDDLLAVGLTDGNGAYRACFDNRDSIGGQGGQDVYVRAVTESGQWRVQDGDADPYAFHSNVHDELGDGRTFDFGRLHTANAAHMPAYHAYDEADDAAAFTPGECWDERDEDCRLIGIRWAPGSTDGTFYDTGDNLVHLRGPDPDTPWVVLHELGHGVMDDVYEGDFPKTDPGNDCDEHFVPRREEPICAWVEGFADWYGAAVLNNPDIPQRGNIDTATWGSNGWDNGDAVEGRVAGALWDLDDAGAETWDNINDSLDNIWNTFLGPGGTARRADTFHDYWVQRGQDGHDVSDTALGALFQNTIDYGFREPLTDGVPLVRPTPMEQHNYRYDTHFAFWSVVAIRPPATADYDLLLFDDRDQKQQLEDSALLAGHVDFIAVDSNAGRRPLGDYYPRVQRLNGAGDYVIDLADSGSLLVSTATRAMGVNDIVAIWDVCLAANEQVTITVTPSDPSQDAQLFLMRSELGNPSTHVRARSAAVASATGQGAGAPETITYTAPEASCHGVVLVNRAGAGTYTITRS